MFDIYTERVISTHPISIGTSLALESILLGPGVPYDPDRKAPVEINLSKYDEYWINIRTLLRNILRAMGTENQKQATVRGLIGTLTGEIEYITSVLASTGAQVKFYAPSYKYLLDKGTYPFMFKKALSPSASAALKMSNDVTAAFAKISGNHAIEASDSNIPFTKGAKVLVTTHYATDLLPYEKASKFDLLESHTGALKTKGVFGSKLYAKDALDTFPLNLATIYIYGDDAFFDFLPHKARAELTAQITSWRWNALTSREKMLHDISRVMNPAIVSALRKALVAKFP